MFRNYLKIAFRNLWKRKIFTVIHILGLSIAFTAAIILFLTAMFEFSFDGFHEHKNTLYQVYFEMQPVSGRQEDSQVPIPFAPVAKEELTGMENITRYGDQGVTARNKDKMFDLTTRFVDPPFVSMFSFSVLRGNTATALSHPNNIVITEETAEKLFGTTNVVGKPLEINAEGKWENFMISAVMANVPENSSLSFDALIRFEKFPAYAYNKDRWNNRNHRVFIQLRPDVSPERFETQSQAFINKYYKEDIQILKRDGAGKLADGSYINLHLLPSRELHFSKIGVGNGTVSSFYPWMLLLLSLLIMFIACSNFINLSLAGSLTRSREIGMRKTLGAYKSQLIIQFWMEAFLICLLAMLIAGLSASFLLPQYNTLLQYKLEFKELFSWMNMAYFIPAFLLITALAGGYPAWLMSGFNIIEILKGKLKLGTGNKLRNVLTITQFVIAITLIIGTLVISRQLDYIQTRPLGYNKDEVISIPIGNDIDPEQALMRMRNALAEVPEVESVTGTDINMGRGRDGSSSTSRMGFEYKNRELNTHWLRIDYDYLKTLDISLLAGRDFTHDFGTDTASVLINEKMAHLLGEKDALGVSLPLGEGHNMKVIGIVKDFNFKDLRQEVQPLTMCLRPQEWPLSYIFVKVKPGNLSHSMKEVEKIWKQVNPRAIVAASYLNENTQNEYKKDKRFSGIIISASVLAITIACMGLFALTILILNQRTKEIGVRKVLGAGVPGIVLLLSGDFVKMIAVAFVIAAPLSWWTMNQWLDDFAYRIHVSIWILLAGGLVVLIIAVVTVAIQTIRSAMANPVKSLRSE